MDRAAALRMSKDMMKKDLESKITFNDFKSIADKSDNDSSTEDMEVYTKSLVICFLFENLSYYAIEDYVMTFGTNIISICNSRDWYNGLSRVISASLEDLSVEIGRRVEIEVLVHLFDLLEIYLKRPELFEESIKKNITKNICEVKTVATMDAAEEFKYEQITIDGITTKNKKEKASEKFSRTNFYRKDNIKKNIRKYIINNYDEEMFTRFIDEFNRSLDQLDISKFSLEEIKSRYKEVIEKLYIYVAPIWLEKEEKKDVNQLTLFDFLG